MKAMLFDFDGTLADTLPLSFNAFKSVFKQYDNREVTNEELVAMFGPTEEGIIYTNFANKPFVPDAIQGYYSYYEKEHHTECQCDQGIIDLLLFLKEHGVKIGVVTGKSRRSFDISAAALQLDSYFDVSITGADVVQPKPHPEGIHKALHTLGIDSENAIFVGDSNADILAGKAAGLRTYAVQWLSTCQSLTYNVEPDGLFTNVMHFRELLEKEVVIHGH
ncbi:HAD family hydrolase [Paenibacillus agilis]|uniref:HAD family hydrolase n=2 Tax=Paenibacillus agilis TaxID=3020863 RepID=A0A559IQF6_9BACL|nr:HAD family hydrolase [Paenibacillus agilis]